MLNLSDGPQTEMDPAEAAAVGGADPQEAAAAGEADPVGAAAQAPEIGTCLVSPSMSPDPAEVIASYVASTSDPRPAGGQTVADPAEAVTLVSSPSLDPVEV